MVFLWFSLGFRITSGKIHGDYDVYSLDDLPILLIRGLGQLFNIYIYIIYMNGV